MSETTNPGRTRTIAWDDPRPGAQAARGLSGLDYLKSMIRGEHTVAPITRVLDFELVEAAEGRAAFVLVPGEQHANPMGAVHGGVLATVLDSALGCAVHTTLPAGTGYTTVELHVNFVRPVSPETGRLRAEAEVVHRGGRVATAQARVVDEAGRLYAHATTTCLLLEAGTVNMARKG